MRILSRLLIFLIIFQCTPAAAQIRPIASLSLIQTRVKQAENSIDPSLSYGAIGRKNNIIATIQTNRFLEQISSRKTKGGLVARSKTTSDSFLIGYAFNKFAPSLLLSSTRVKKEFQKNGQIVSTQTAHALLHGVNFTYFFKKNISGSVFYVAPNSSLQLRDAAGLAVNFIF
jgi:hypothetical protein